MLGNKYVYTCFAIVWVFIYYECMIVWLCLYDCMATFPLFTGGGGGGGVVVVTGGTWLVFA